MNEANPLAAEILEASATGYASAASMMLQQDKGAGTVPDGWGSSEWKAHLRQRILELATAIRVNKPELLARRMSWLRRAVKARGAPESDLRAALESIQLALDKELPESLKLSVAQPIQLALESFESELEPEAAALDASTPAGRLGLEYLTACLEARSEDAIALILNALEKDMSPEDVYADVLLPAQREIGQLWHVGDVSISEERMVSETTRSVMTLIVHQYSPPLESGPTVISASVAGNAHDIGLRALANLFRLAGWRSIFLGASTPSLEIGHAAQAFDADLILLSATLTTQLSTLTAVIDKIHQIASHTRILVGGLALDDSPELWKEIGADAYAGDIRSAVEVGASLIDKK